MFWLVIILAICFFFVRRYLNKRIEFLKKKYDTQILVALNMDKWDSFHPLTKDEKRKILCLNEEELEKWRLLFLKAKEIARRYPDAFVEQVIGVNKAIKSRPYYDYHSIMYSHRISDKAILIAESLTIDELQFVLSEPEEHWMKLEAERKDAIRIRTDYSKGFEIFKKHVSGKISNSDICHNESNINLYQKMYDTAESYNAWEKTQIEFCSKIWQLYKDCRPEDGRYVYEVPYNKPNEEGKKCQSTFKIWQGFVYGYTPFCSNILTEEYLQKITIVDDLKVCRRYFQASIYESLFNMLNTCTEQIGEKPLVIVVRKNEFNWSQSTYDYHLKKFFDRLRDNEYELIDRDELSSLSRERCYKMAIIFDLITTNEQLFYNSSLVVEHFSYAIPHIAYYSVIKQYNEDETKKLLKDEIEKRKKAEEEELARLQELKNNEDKGKAFVKELFLKQEKNSFFSYLAITNTLIGEASEAEQIKKVWLNTPEKFHIKSVERLNGHISCEYSVDYEMSFSKFEIEYQDDLEGNVCFAYYLFVKMEVWQQFLEKGKDAIEAMNRMQCLKYH